MLAPWKKSYDKPKQCTKKQRHHFANKGLSSQSYGFSSSCVWMWDLDKKESWALKNWCFWIVVLEKTLKSPLDSKEIKPVSPKGNQPVILIGRTDVEAETPILWPPDVKSWLIWKDPDAGKDWGQEKKGMTEDEMVGWHHQLDGHQFEQVPGVGDGQESLVCCNPWCHKQSDMTERLTWTELNWSCSLQMCEQDTLSGKILNLMFTTNGRMTFTLYFLLKNLHGLNVPVSEYLECQWNLNELRSCMNVCDSRFRE